MNYHTYLNQKPINSKEGHFSDRRLIQVNIPINLILKYIKKKIFNINKRLPWTEVRLANDVLKIPNDAKLIDVKLDKNFDLNIILEHINFDIVYTSYGIPQYYVRTIIK